MLHQLLWCSATLLLLSASNSLRSPMVLSSRTRSMQLLASPPNTFPDCIKQAVISTNMAIERGDLLLEVEFPPLPLAFLDDQSVSARDISNANTRWALAFAQAFSANGLVSIIYPDQAELEDALMYLSSGSRPVEIKNGNSPSTNVSLSTIRQDSIRNAESVDQAILSIFGAKRKRSGAVKAIDGTVLYLVVVSSAQELPDIEKLHELAPNVPIVLFNLKLDQLKGDLGLPLFPPRDLQYRFLSKVRPSFYLKTSNYATSIKRPPFVVNYSGQLFRAYPDDFHIILNTGENKSRTVSTLIVFLYIFVSSFYP
jgi:hypothetical protein